jgi:ABC-type multidrug transport system ATPase subunit
VTSAAPVIDAWGLTRDYPAPGGPLLAIENVRLALAPGERLAVVGPSGSGKSTLLRILAGREAPSAGRVSVVGRDLGQRPRDLGPTVRLLGRRPEAALWPGLTASENVRLAAGGPAGQALATMALDGREHVRAGELTLGQRRRLAFAAALAAQPLLLLADDPTSELDSGETDELLACLDRALEGRRTSLVVAVRDHHEAPVVDRMLELPAARLPNAVLALPRPPAEPGATARPRVLVMRAVRVTRRRGLESVVLRDLDLDVREGQLVTVNGGSDAERSAIAALAAGREEPDRGRVEVGGRRARRSWRRVGWLAARGEPSPLTVADAAALSARLAGASRRQSGRLVPMVLRATGLEHHAATPVSRLCGWEERCAALAAALAKVPELVVADDPTAGLDQRSAALVLAALREAADSGVAVLVTAQSPAAANVADRVLAIQDGYVQDLRQ